ncbi:MAG: nitroreductase family protein, partial [Pyrinomonadaceae bacterium]
LSGDWIPVTLPERVRALSPQARVVSLGGATEASIWSILYEIEEVEAGWRSIPYGRPMVNQQFHVLNEALEPCPVWVTGQLHIGGVGLAKGYWKDEEKSGRSFIRHPVSGERLYRTGDMGRYLPDGEIEFLGREDTQVKVEGHRIELGEVEAALEGHERVRGAVALAVGPARTKRHLVAYVVLKEAHGEDVEGPVGGVESPLTMPSFALRETSNEPDAAAHSGNGGPAHAHGNGHDANGAARPAERAGDSTSISQPMAAGRRARAHSATTSEEFGSLLARLSQLRLDEQPLPKYQYPSAGNLYPVQTYVLVKPGGVEGVEAGLYYYDPRAHQLRLVGDREALRAAAFEPADRIVFEQSAFALFMVARMEAIVPMYGEMSPDFCALEAGYMGRLLTASARAADISLRSLTRVDFSHLRESFDVDESHVLVHALAGSRLDAAADDLGEHAATLPALTPRVLAGAPKAGVDVGAATAWGQMADLVERAVAQAQTLSKIERLEFKLREVGLRQEAAGEKRLALWKSQADGAFVEEFTYRRSDREFLGRAVASGPLRELLEVLTHARSEPESLLCGLRSLPAEQYPVQTYLYVKAERVEGLAGGLYHHDRQSGALTLLTADIEIDSSAHAEPNREIAEQSAFMLMLVADLGKAGAAFGEWARDLCLLEAGYAGQTLLTEAPVRGLGLCPVGWIDFERLRRHLRIGDGQVLLHSFLGGAVEPRYKPGHAAARPTADASHPEGARRHKLSAAPRQDAATTEELRAFLGRKLPDYMIPRVIFLLDELPLSANGKVDRNALAALDVGAAGSGANAVAPRTPVEQQLADLWRDLLGVERVGVHDTFFALGGDSVTAIRFLARARDAGLEISLTSFFENPTIARLAEAAQPSGPTAADAAPSPTLEPAGGGLDVADFPDADLTQEELDQLIDDFEVPE